ncbi:MAG: hypothetical protein Q8O64_09970 [Sideroxyarcus sp.]|nr:hypothetical protein [Sideroxyarcus sp.]
MENLVSWALFIAASSVAIAAVLDAVKSRAENADTKAKNEILEQEHSVLMAKNQSLEKQLHVFTSGEREEEKQRLVAQQQLVDKLNSEIIV